MVSLQTNPIISPFTWTFQVGGVIHKNKRCESCSGSASFSKRDIFHRKSREHSDVLKPIVSGLPEQEINVISLQQSLNDAEHTDECYLITHHRVLIGFQ